MVRKQAKKKRTSSHAGATSPTEATVCPGAPCPRPCRAHYSLRIAHTAQALGVLLRPLRQRLILLLLRELQVFLAKEPEPRPLRPVLAPRVAAAHVALGAPRPPGNPIAAGLR